MISAIQILDAVKAKNWPLRDKVVVPVCDLIVLFFAWLYFCGRARRFKGIRCFIVDGSRIGHLVEGIGGALHVQNTDVGGELSVFSVIDHSVNPAFVEVAGRTTCIHWSRLVTRSAVRTHERFGALPFCFDMPLTYRSIHGLRSNKTNGVSLNERERERGAAMLQARYGIEPNDWFIGFHARDPAYLNAIEPDRDWSYHNYRDSHISALRQTVDDVVAQGGWAIRIGTNVGQPLGTEWGRQALDYANDDNDPFLDLYIIERARYVIVGGGSGVGHLAQALGTPVLWSNFIPLIPWPWCEKDLLLPKLMARENAGNAVLTFSEMHGLGMFSEDAFSETGFYQREGLAIIDNTAEDILCAAREMNARAGHAGPFKETSLQRQFRDNFVPNGAGGGMISHSFLERHPELMAETRNDVRRQERP